MKNHYQILGVPHDASKEDVKRAYYILAGQFHPDKNNGSEERFKEIVEAYRILSYESTRAEYDAKLSANQVDGKQETKTVWQKVEKPQSPIRALLIASVPIILSLLFVAYLIIMNLKGEEESVNIPPPPQEFTHPDYLKNPSAYLPDPDNTIGSQIPIGKPLWVEEVTNPWSLKVSYSVDKAGKSIMVFNDMVIPGVGGNHLSEDCRYSVSKDYVEKKLLHTEVYLADEGYEFSTSTGRLFMSVPDGKDTADIAELIVADGFGTTPLFWREAQESSYAYPFTRQKNLEDAQAVARLAKRGFWGMCQ